MEVFGANGVDGTSGGVPTRALRGVECKVRVGEYLSEAFEVTTGLRQGCVLSLLLFSLYINGALEKLGTAKVGIMCREELALLFADDMVG